MTMKSKICHMVCKLINGNAITRNDPTIGVGLGRVEGEHAVLEYIHSRGMINDEALTFHKLNGVPKEFYHDEG